MTPKALDELRVALSLRADLVALSFVRSASDVEDVRREMDAVGARLPVIAKLEKPEAVAKLEEIVDAFDGLMVARGDLGVEMPLEQVPPTQKRAVRLARERCKPVIVATQMLESMVHHASPTRAEASDVANAVFDGADAVMLSAETSVGEHPIEAVATMARIIAAAEGPGIEALRPLAGRPNERQDAIVAAAARIADDIGACALVAFTRSGGTVRRLASQRSTIPLLAFTTEPAVRSQLALVWGVQTFVVPRMSQTDEMIGEVEKALLALGRGKPGELVVFVAGTPPGTEGSTNMVRVHRLGE
jgi:pyruvate kinase